MLPVRIIGDGSKTRHGQRQQTYQEIKKFAASVKDPENDVTVKGSNYTKKSRNLLLPPKTRRMMSRSKAAIIPRNQEICCFGRRPEETRPGQRQQSYQEIKKFAASAKDPKRYATVKGSNRTKKSRICCFRQRLEPSRLPLARQSTFSIR